MVNKLSLEERLELTRKLRKSGANCGRCVVLSFPDYTEGEISAERLGAIGDALGGGVGGCGLTCGAVTGMAVADGFGRPSTLTKAQIYKRVSALAGEFDANNGSTSCRVLQTELGRDCTGLILDAVEILHKRFAADED